MSIKNHLYRLLAVLGIIKFMRISSAEIFKMNENGTVAIVKPIRIGGVSLNNVVFSHGVRIGSLELTSLLGKDLEATIEDGVYNITAFYERS